MHECCSGEKVHKVVILPNHDQIFMCKCLQAREKPYCAPIQAPFLAWEKTQYLPQHKCQLVITRNIATWNQLGKNKL